MAMLTDNYLCHVRYTNITRRDIFWFFKKRQSLNLTLWQRSIISDPAPSLTPALSRSSPCTCTSECSQLYVPRPSVICVRWRIATITTSVSIAPFSVRGSSFIIGGVIPPLITRTRAFPFARHYQVSLARSDSGYKMIATSGSRNTYSYSYF